MKTDRFILACQDYFIKQRDAQPVHQHRRMHRDTVDGEAIARCQRKRQPVRIPALNGAEWGQLLRSLELKRAYA